jgi:hypothetical protein
VFGYRFSTHTHTHTHMSDLLNTHPGTAKHCDRFKSNSESTSLVRDVYELCSKVKDHLNSHRTSSILPPEMDLTRSKYCEIRDMLAWDVEDPMPNPGQLTTPLKYIPIDMLQIPVRARSIKEAIHAISVCEQICTLIESQPHCVKNQKFLIAAAIEHVFVQVVPCPKPRNLKNEVVISEGATKSQSGCIWTEPMT